MYKKTHDANQARADRKRVLELQSGDDAMPLTERYEMLKAKVQRMQSQIHSLPHGSPERKQLGINIAKINFELSSMKGQKRPGINDVFVEVAHRILPREQYDALLKEAQHVYDLRHAPAKKKSAAKYAEELGRALEKSLSPKP